jgi:hypothetical protein
MALMGATRNAKYQYFTHSLCTFFLYSCLECELLEQRQDLKLVKRQKVVAVGRKGAPSVCEPPGVDDASGTLHALGQVTAKRET